MIALAKRYPIRKFLGVGLMILTGMLSNGLAQKAEQELPLVIAGKMPLYPIMPRLARVEGVVKIRVTTDGRRSLPSKRRVGHRCL